MWPRIRWIIISVFVLVTVLVWVTVWLEMPSKFLTVAFLDVGQGDAILITTPNKNQVLIDGGPDKKILRALGSAMPFFDHSLDLVMESHPDADHINGLPDVFQRFSVGAFMEPPISGKTNIYQALKTEVKNEPAPDIIAQKGTRIVLDNNVYLDVLWTNAGGKKADTNEASIVAKLTYGQNSFLFTGDSPESVESYMAYPAGDKLKADVLKVSHHGSKNSNPEIFLKKVKPEFAVISVGAKNKYGHPNQEVVDRLNSIKAQILMTKDLGTITLKSDGESVGF